MSDLTTLDDAFAELERRAEVFVAAEPAPTAHRSPATQHRVWLAAASVVAVAAVATTVAIVAGDGSDTSGNGQTPRQAAGAPVHSSVPAHSSAPPHPLSASPSGSSPAVIGSEIPVPPATSLRPPSARVPQNAAQLAQRLRAVLGGKATFTYSAPAGADTPVITGILNRTSPHRRGGFDLQIDIGSPGDTAICEDPGASTCSVRKLADHSSLSVDRELGSGTLYLVNLVRPNGVSLLMHVSTRSDPKGAGANYGSTPPLSTKEMVRLLESPKWRG